jgi:hypothetical protein
MVDADGFGWRRSDRGLGGLSARGHLTATETEEKPKRVELQLIK